MAKNVKKDFMLTDVRVRQFDANVEVLKTSWVLMLMVEMVRWWLTRCRIEVNFEGFYMDFSLERSSSFLSPRGRVSIVRASGAWIVRADMPEPNKRERSSVFGSGRPYSLMMGTDRRQIQELIETSAEAVK